jgi:hypothetical protein
LYVTDKTGNRIIARNPAGVITAVAGNGVQGFGGDGGPATAAMLNLPISVDITPDGRLFIADSFNNRVRMVQGGIISTVMGSGVQPNSQLPPVVGSNPLGFAIRPDGVAWDSVNNLLFVSTGFGQQIVARDFGVVPPTATVTQTTIFTSTSTKTPISTPTRTATLAPTCFPGCIEGM